MLSLREMCRLARAAYSLRERMGPWTLEGRFHRRRGFAASLWVDRPRGAAVLSVRGTRGSADCLQDLRLLLGWEPRAWREGRSALRRARQGARAGLELYLTGHSIGGAYAAALGAESGTPSVTFNAPGMLEVLTRGEGEGWILRRPGQALNVCALEDFIWRLSGPGLARELLVPVADGVSAECPTGPRGVWAAWRSERRRRSGTRGFVRRALRLHGLPALEAHAASASGERLWGRDVDELLRATACAGLPVERGCWRPTREDRPREAAALQACSTAQARA